MAWYEALDMTNRGISRWAGAVACEKCPSRVFDVLPVRGFLSHPQSSGAADGSCRSETWLCEAGRPSNLEREAALQLD